MDYQVLRRNSVKKKKKVEEKQKKEWDTFVAKRTVGQTLDPEAQDLKFQNEVSIVTLFIIYETVFKHIRLYLAMDPTTNFSIRNQCSISLVLS